MYMESIYMRCIWNPYIYAMYMESIYIYAINQWLTIYINEYTYVLLYSLLLSHRCKDRWVGYCVCFVKIAFLFIRQTMSVLQYTLELMGGSKRMRLCLCLCVCVCVCVYCGMIYLYIYIYVHLFYDNKQPIIYRWFRCK